jgi:hypothetical protein
MGGTTLGKKKKTLPQLVVAFLNYLFIKFIAELLDYVD